MSRFYLFFCYLSTFLENIQDYMMSHEMSQVIAYLLFHVTCHMSLNFPFLILSVQKKRKCINTKSCCNSSCFPFISKEIGIFSHCKDRFAVFTVLVVLHILVLSYISAFITHFLCIKLFCKTTFYSVNKFH